MTELGELFKLYLLAKAKSDKFLPVPAFALMLGYTEDELRELYQRELDQSATKSSGLRLPP